MLQYYYTSIKLLTSFDGGLVLLLLLLIQRIPPNTAASAWQGEQKLTVREHMFTKANQKHANCWYTRQSNYRRTGINIL